MNAPAQRAHWDTTFKASKVLKTFAPRPSEGVSYDEALRVEFKVPYLLRVAGMPDEMGMRLTWRDDAPNKGEATCIVAPWDETNSGGAAAASAFFKAAVFILRPHPTSPEAKTQYVGVEGVAGRQLPDWLLGWIARTFSPRMMLDMVSRYTRYAKGASAARVKEGS